MTIFKCPKCHSLVNRFMEEPAISGKSEIICVSCVETVCVITSEEDWNKFREEVLIEESETNES